MNKLFEKIKSNFTKEKIKAGIKETVETVVFVLVAVIIIRFFIGEIRWIPSASMHPTLLEGDRLFIERFSRFYKTPDRGDMLYRCEHCIRVAENGKMLAKAEGLPEEPLVIACLLHDVGYRESDDYGGRH